MEIKMLEMKAVQIYSDLLPLITEEKDKIILRGIIKDEKRHTTIAQEMIELLTS